MIKRIKAKRKRKWPFFVGDKVMLDTSKILDMANYKRDFYPEDGAIGTVVETIGRAPTVQWPEGSTSLNDRWLCPTHWLKKVE